MPNGVDKSLRRLMMACALYRQRYGEWPSEARLPAYMLHNLAHILDGHEFAKLAAHIQLRTKDKDAFSVGGSRGHIEYAGPVGLKPEVMALTERWLDVKVRRDLDEFD